VVTPEALVYVIWEIHAPTPSTAYMTIQCFRLATVLEIPAVGPDSLPDARIGQRNRGIVAEQNSASPSSTSAAGPAAESALMMTA